MQTPSHASIQRRHFRRVCYHTPNVRYHTPLVCYHTPIVCYHTPIVLEKIAPEIRPRGVCYLCLASSTVYGGHPPHHIIGNGERTVIPRISIIGTRSYERGMNSHSTYTWHEYV